MQQLQHYSNFSAARKQKKHFQLTYDKKSLTTEVYYFRVRSFSRSVYGNFQLCQKVNAKDAKNNTYVAISKVLLCSTKRIQLEILQYVEDMIINFDRAVEI